MDEEFGMRNSEFGISALAPATFRLRRCSTGELEEIQNSKFKIQNSRTGQLG